MDGATRCGGRRRVTPSNWLATLPTYSPGVWHKRTKIPLDSKGLMSFQQSMALAMVSKGCRLG
ncbi:hypothetical protein GE21DRAFT_1306248 [Neurospora crassa]|nr:hypothetical protein GE21DRAFT_1306248 [Neurospora crassa]